MLSITQFHAGSAGNVIPDEAVLNGTVRTLLPDIQDQIEPLMCEIIENTAAGPWRHRGARLSAAATPRW